MKLGNTTELLHSRIHKQGQKKPRTKHPHFFPAMIYCIFIQDHSFTKENSTNSHIINSTPAKSVFLHLYPKPWRCVLHINAKSIGEPGGWVWFFEGMNFLQLLHQIFFGHLLWVPIFIHVPEMLKHKITTYLNIQNSHTLKTLTTDTIILDINMSQTEVALS